MHAAGGNLESEAAATGVYIGCMYTEYLDAILGPSVSSQSHVVPTHWPRLAGGGKNTEHRAHG